MGKELEKIEKNGMIVAGNVVPEYILKNGIGDKGSENVGHGDLIFPQIKITQALSPEKDKLDPKFIPGAETDGTMFNSLTKVVYDDDLYFVPVFFRKDFVIWKDRDQGGGCFGIFDTFKEARDALHELDEKDGPYCNIYPTDQHYILILLEHGFEEAVLSMARTKLYVSQRINSLVRLSGLNRFALRFRMKTVQVKSPKGKYFNFDVEIAGFPPEDIFFAAEKLYEELSSGRRKAAADLDIDYSAEDSADSKVPF